MAIQLVSQRGVPQLLGLGSGKHPLLDQASQPGFESVHHHILSRLAN